MNDTLKQIEQIEEILNGISIETDEAPTVMEVNRAIARLQNIKASLKSGLFTDYSKECKCENSIGQTWCCNLCGNPYIDKVITPLPTAGVEAVKCEYCNGYGCGMCK